MKKNKLLLLIILFGLVVTLTGCNDKKEIKIKTIDTEVKSTDDAKNYMIITAYDEDDKEVWKYETEKVYVGQAENVEYFKTRKNKVLINVDGTIIALDKKTGKKVWENTEYKGSGSVFTYDDDNNLYLVGWNEPSLFIIDENGKTVKRLKNTDIESLTWPQKMEIEKNVLTVYYPFPGEDDLYFKVLYNVDELTNKDNKVLDKIIAPKYEGYEISGFENITSFELNQDGKVYINFKKDSYLNKIYEGRLMIEENVISISPVMDGSIAEGRLIMIKQDGTVSILNSYEVADNIVEVRNLDLKDVDYTFTYQLYDGVSTMFVKKDGTVTDNYKIKK